MLELRGHARGGQGMVTAFEILAKIFSQLGDFQVQAFPAFGVERTGAPIQAFLRAAEKAILNRSNVYHPHLIVVFDESLLGQVSVFDGLKPGGAVLINTERPVEAFGNINGEVYTVPATRIAVENGLGSRSLPIVNAAMIGAVGRLFGIDPELIQGIVADNVPAKPEANAQAAAMAYEAIVGLSGTNEYLQQRLWSPLPEVEMGEVPIFQTAKTSIVESLDAPAWSGPLSKNKTGNWRVVTPEYVDRTPPCNANCPAGTDVRTFVRLASERRFDEAVAVLAKHNPFPGICGRVCPHFCEQHCNRNELDGGVNIGAVERFLGDRAMKREVQPAPLRFTAKIAVVGAGPAGLTAALRLRRKGYPVTVFEALPKAGGMMRTGIPKFRLPDEVLDQEIAQIEKEGVEIRLDHKVRVDELAGDFQAVIVAVGSHLGSALGLSNEHLVVEGISFLRQFKLDGFTNGIKRGDHVAIIGGGNTAIDVARTALRLGAMPAIYYRRTLQEMPAIAQEVEEARAEGVQLELLTAPVGIEETAAGRIALTMQAMKLGEPDASGRRRPVPVPGSEQTILVDKVISAIGQRFDDAVFSFQAVKPKQGRIPFETNVPVFCSGDMAWGGTVTEAIGSGNKVAEEVHAFLEGREYHPAAVLPEVVLPQDINWNYYMPVPRHLPLVHHPRDLYEDFTEVTRGLGEAELVAETARCLHCGDCFKCGNCFNFCPDAAIHVDEEGRLRIDYDYCKGCGICVQECPCSAIHFESSEANV